MTDFKVADLSLAEFGPQRDPPRRARDARPDGDARRVRRDASRSRAPASPGSLHMTIQTAVLIETLVDPRRRGALGLAATSSRPRTTRPPPSWSARTGTADDPQGVPVFAWKGETLEEYWWCTEQILRWPDGGTGPEHDPRRRRRRHPARRTRASSSRRPAPCPTPTRPTSEEYAVVLGRSGAP